VVITQHIDAPCNAFYLLCFSSDLSVFLHLIVFCILYVAEISVSYYIMLLARGLAHRLIDIMKGGARLANHKVTVSGPSQRL